MVCPPVSVLSVLLWPASIVCLAVGMCAVVCIWSVLLWSATKVSMVTAHEAFSSRWGALSSQEMFLGGLGVGPHTTVIFHW